jgi:uncharacterized protein (TIGR03435 family)
MKVKVLALCLSAVMLVGCAEKADETCVEAPALAVETVIHGPEPADLSWPALSGQAVVLEFWATWCGPCVDAIPEWNELVDTFADEPVRFIAVSDDDQALLRKFLEKKPIHGWVTIDSDRSMFEAYDVHGIPHTFLIDSRGRIRASTHPQSLSEHVIRDLLAGKTPDVPVKKKIDPEQLKTVAADGGPEPIFEATIRPSKDTKMRMMSVGPGQYMSIGAQIRDSFRFAYSARTSRLVIEAELPEQPYDLVFSTAGKDELLFPLMRQAIEASFDIEARTEQRELDVHVLSRATGVTPKLTPATLDVERPYAKPGSLTCLSITLGLLADTLERLLQQPVLDTTGIDGLYEIDLSWDPEQPDSLPEAVREQLGLELKAERRTLEVQVIRNTRTQ